MVQLWIVILVVAAAVSYLGWTVFRAIRADSGSACAGGCGCSSVGSEADRLGRRMDLVSLGRIDAVPERRKKLEAGETVQARSD